MDGPGDLGYWIPDPGYWIGGTSRWIERPSVGSGMLTFRAKTSSALRWIEQPSVGSGMLKPRGTILHASRWIGWPSIGSGMLDIRENIARLATPEMVLWQFDDFNAFLCRPLSSSLSSPVFLCRPLSSSCLRKTFFIFYKYFLRNEDDRGRHKNTGDDREDDRGRHKNTRTPA